MGDMYFSRDPSSSDERLHFRIQYAGEDHPWTAFPGVFARTRLDVGTALLLDCAAEAPGTRVLDLGCGHGPLGLLHLRRTRRAGGPPTRLWLLDPNPRACAASQANARTLGLEVGVLQADGGACLADGAVDLVLCNPPIRAGLEVILRLWQDSARVLAEGGWLYFVGRPKQGGRRLARLASEALGGEPEKLGRNKGYEVFRIQRLSRARG